MSAEVIVIGLDAIEVDIIDRLVADGRMPTFARLADTAAQVTPSNCLETLPGAIWPELCTGVAGWRSGLYFHPRQLRTGDSRFHQVTEDELPAEDHYWVAAARAGKRVLAVDMPQTALTPGLEGSVQVSEWGVHDRMWGVRAEPPEVLADIRAKWGDATVHICDLHGDTTTGFRRLRDDLVTQVETKRGWLSELVAGRAWDLVTCSFGESHCAGHQLLHFYDDANPWHEPGAPDDLRDGLPRVYEAIDAAVGAVLDAAGPQATAIVVASHGMDYYVGGYQLLEPVLRAMERSSSSKVLAAPSRLPAPLRAVARALVPKSVRFRRREAGGDLEWPLESGRTRAIAVPNNRIGGIRFNLVGREPHGSVAPGPDAEALAAEITEVLLGLRQPGSGELIVTTVERADQLFGPERHPDVPDLIVRFRTDLGPLESCESPAVGRLDSPVRHPDLPRSGDHTPHSRWWVRAPGVAAGALATDVDILDLAPTVLSLLDVTPRDGLDGHALTL